jgi:hypothetical protein
MKSCGICNLEEKIQAPEGRTGRVGYHFVEVSWNTWLETQHLMKEKWAIASELANSLQLNRLEAKTMSSMTAEIPFRNPGKESHCSTFRKNNSYNAPQLHLRWSISQI